MAAEDTDHWATAVEMFTGYEMPERSKIFGENGTALEPNGDAPLVSVSIKRVPFRVMTVAEYQATSGLNVGGHDFVIHYYQPPLDNPEESDLDDYSKEELEEKIYPQLHEIAIDFVSPDGGDVELPFSDPFGWSRDGDSSLTGMKNGLGQYVEGAGNVLYHLGYGTVTTPNDIGFSSNGIPIDVSQALDFATFTRTAQAYDRVAKFFVEHAETLKQWKESLGRDTAAWQGKAAGVFAELIDGLHKNYAGYADQMHPSGFSAEHQAKWDWYASSSLQGDAILGAGNTILHSIRAMYQAWQDWESGTNAEYADIVSPDADRQYRYLPGLASPYGILVSMLQSLSEWVFNHNTRFLKLYRWTGTETDHYTGGYSAGSQSTKDRTTSVLFWGLKPEAERFIPGHGWLHSVSTWSGLGVKAVNSWNQGVEDHLTPAGNTALVNVNEAFNDAKRVLDKVLESEVTSYLGGSGGSGDYGSSGDGSGDDTVDDSYQDAIDDAEAAAKAAVEAAQKVIDESNEHVKEVIEENNETIEESNAATQAAIDANQDAIDESNAKTDEVIDANNDAIDESNAATQAAIDANQDAIDELDTTGDQVITDTGDLGLDGTSQGMTVEGDLITPVQDDTDSLLQDTGGNQSIDEVTDQAITDVGNQITPIQDSSTSQLGDTGSNQTTDSVTDQAITDANNQAQSIIDDANSQLDSSGNSQSIVPVTGLGSSSSSLTDNSGSSSRRTDGVTVQNPDGSTTTSYPDGTEVTTDPDGTVTQTDPDGTVSVVKPDGSVTVTTPDGQVVSGPSGQIITDADGQTTITGPSGQITTNPDGSVSVDGPSGSTTTSSDGTVTVTGPDGSTTITSPDGSVQVTTPNGEITTTYPDGTISVTSPDGSTTVTSPDGSTTGGNQNTIDDADAAARSAVEKANQVIAEANAAAKQAIAESNAATADAIADNHAAVTDANAAARDAIDEANAAAQRAINEVNSQIGSSILDDTTTDYSGNSGNSSDLGSGGSSYGYQGDSGSDGYAYDDAAAAAAASGSGTGYDGGTSDNPFVQGDQSGSSSNALGGSGSNALSSSSSGSGSGGGSPMMPPMGGMRGGGGESPTERERSSPGPRLGRAATRRAAQAAAGRRTARPDEELEEDVITTRAGAPFTPAMPPPAQRNGTTESSGDRARAAWVTEDEDVWGTDEGTTPAVIGR